MLVIQSLLINMNVKNKFELLQLKKENQVV